MCSERALTMTLAKMYVQGVSIREVLSLPHIPGSAVSFICCRMLRRMCLVAVCSRKLLKTCAASSTLRIGLLQKTTWRRWSANTRPGQANWQTEWSRLFRKVFRFLPFQSSTAAFSARQCAGTAEPGNPAPHAGREHFPERGFLAAADQCDPDVDR